MCIGTLKISRFHKQLQFIYNVHISHNLQRCDVSIVEFTYIQSIYNVEHYNRKKKTLKKRLFSLKTHDVTMSIHT